MKFDQNKAALTGGLIWALTMFFMTIISVGTGYAKAFLDVMASIYPGYNVSFSGSVVGLIYGFLDVYVGVYIVLWVYKVFSK
jgi:hypothetical protein